MLTSLPIDAFPDDVSNYVTLSLVGNNIRRIPDVVKKMKNLESLSLCGNPLKVNSFNNNYFDCISVTLLCDLEAISSVPANFFAVLHNKRRIDTIFLVWLQFGNQSCI